ncbi:hypothetical protein [Pasteurella sp. PK-2025]|uniref:hypothetical protein n=1 Tax=Pasteurella sp. PK-2025 TaxID=3413133 RepID=UPI003C779289
MKPVINVAVALLLSLGLVACGGGGGGSTSNNNAAAVNPNLPKDDVNYIELNDSNSKSITLVDGKEEKIEKTYTYLSLYKKGNDILIAPKTKDLTNVSYKEELMKLDAKYNGVVLLSLKGEDNNNSQIKQRSAIFNLNKNQISGHSVKTSTDDIQVIFKASQVKEIKNQHLGFEGQAEVNKNQKLITSANYFGEFAGSKAENIAGYFVETEHRDQNTQPKVSGGFIATREVVAESTPAPKQ